MKRVEIAPSIQADSKLGSLVQRATQLLDKSIGRSSPGVSATWSLLRDERDRPLLRLDISDDAANTEPAYFAPDELANDWHVEGRMLRLWGDLLQERSHKQLDEILKRSEELGTV